MIIAVIPAPGHEALVAEGPQVDGCVPERPMTIDVLRPGDRHPCVDGCLMNIFRDAPLDLSGLRPGDECPGCCDRGLVSVTALVLHAPGDPKLGTLRAMEAVGVTRVSTMPPVGGVSEMMSHGDWYEVAVEPSPDFGFGAHAQAWSLAHLLVQRGIAAEVIVLPADKAKE